MNLIPNKIKVFKLLSDGDIYINSTLPVTQSDKQNNLDIDFNSLTYEDKEQLREISGNTESYINSLYESIDKLTGLCRSNIKLYKSLVSLYEEAVELKTITDQLIEKQSN